MEYIIEMNNITKRFNDFTANDGINLKIKKGEIHALLGENGAGKSTLMNILFGLYQPDFGEIKVRGEKVIIDSPNKANDLGIGMVHQHFMLIDRFSATENIMLGEEITKGILVDYSSGIDKVSSLSKQYGLEIDPTALIEDVSVGMQQRVEILKILYRGSEIIIFDEPTAVLTPKEIEEFLSILNNLKKEGKTILLITHKLKEILAVCDRCTVLRKGKSIETINVFETNMSQLSSLMVGREISVSMKKVEKNPQKVILKIENLNVKNAKGLNVVKNLSLEVKAGEILGLAGVDGNGQSELIEAITGLRKATSGKIFLNDTDITNYNPRQVTLTGLGHIPEDRHKHGLVLDFDIGENTILQTYFSKQYSKNKVIDYKKMYAKAEDLVEKYDVRTSSVYNLARELSGGNQQKVIIARELDRNPDVIIASQPTRGLDIGAIEYIHKQLINERDNDKAILLVSLDLEEILNISDRIAVIFEGEIIEIIDTKNATEQKIGFLMAGGKKKVGEMS